MHAERIGRRRRIWPLALLCIVLPPLAVWQLTDATLTVVMPELAGFDIRGGGAMTPELSALVIGLTTYASAFVAEIVRAGIQGVPRGQREAASALGLRMAPTLRLVVLPQALRIIVPPLTSEYLGIIKNSSLAVAVGYPDLVAIVNSTMSDTGQAIEGVAIIMLAFLAISLALSLFMNWYNARVVLTAGRPP
jgi:general L-amino acid transport system permease protein